MKLLTLNFENSNTENPDDIYEVGTLNRLYNLILESEEKNIPISEEVIDHCKEDSAAIILWAVKYKKARTPELEPYFLSNEDGSNFILSYLKNFPEVKDGPLWDKVVKDPLMALRYAHEITKGRFEEAEEVIMESTYHNEYVEMLRRYREEGEE